MRVLDAHGITKDVVGLIFDLEGIRKVSTALKKVDKGLHRFFKR